MIFKFAVVFCFVVGTLLPSASHAKLKGTNKGAAGVDIQKILKEVGFLGEVRFTYSIDRDAYLSVGREKEKGPKYYGFLGMMKTAEAYRLFKKSHAAARRNERFLSLIKEAKIYLDKARELAPDQFARIYYDHGVICYLEDRLAEALGSFFDALRIDPKSDLAANGAVTMLDLMWNKLSEEQRVDWSRQVAGRLGSRLKELKSGAALDDYLTTARLYYNTENLEPAMYYVESGLKNYPDDPSLLFARALIWGRAGEFNMAIEDADKVLSKVSLKDKLGRDTMYVKALSLLGKGDKNSAKDLLEKLLEVDGNFQPAKILLEQ